MVLRNLIERNGSGEDCFTACFAVPRFWGFLTAVSARISLIASFEWSSLFCGSGCFSDPRPLIRRGGVTSSTGVSHFSGYTGRGFCRSGTRISTRRWAPFSRSGVGCVGRGVGYIF